MVFIAQNGINIKSVQANSVYMVNNEYDNVFFDFGKAVLPNSLFSEYMRHHGMTVKSKGKKSKDTYKEYTDDFVVVKFDYGVCAKQGREALSTLQLRRLFYEEGFIIRYPYYSDDGQVKYYADPIKYKMLMRSPGKAKEGQCIFIRDHLHKKAADYLTMGLYDKMPQHNTKIVEMAAYSTMTTATAQDFIQIPLNNILILEDEEVSTVFNALSVEVKNEECVVNRDNDKQEISNILWDGMGLIDESVFPENMEGFIYCRSHFFKACLFPGMIQQYFIDYYGNEYDTATVKDMFGNQIKIKDIKVITTNNAIKWIKFKDLMGKTDRQAYRYFRKKMKHYGNKFAIIKTGHKSKWDNLQRSSYQINNSLPNMSYGDLEKVASESVEYCNKLKLDHTFFMDYLKHSAQEYSISNVLIALDEYNSEFKNTRYFKEKKTKIISKLKSYMKQGKLFQIGDNLTICGNPIALLKKATGQDFLNEGCFAVESECIQCYTSRFAEGEYLAGFRSPHNSPNNIISLKNVYPNILLKYFPNLGDTVIVINGIYTDIQSRANGQDLDSDSLFVTNQYEIVKSAKYAYTHHPTIVNNIPVNGISKYNNDAESYAMMDYKISSAQMTIGYASNIAQLALTYYFDALYNNQTDDLIELEDVFVICSVLAQCAIDSAKRSFTIDINKTLKKIKNKKCMRNQCQKNHAGQNVVLVPSFYAENQNKKCKEWIRNLKVVDYKCPMGILHDIVDRNVIDLRFAGIKSKNIIDLSDILLSVNYKSARKNFGKQIKKIVSMAEMYHKKIYKLDKNDQNYANHRQILYNNIKSDIKKYKIHMDTMQYLIRYALDDSGICDDMMLLLFTFDKNMFLSCFCKSE